MYALDSKQPLLSSSSFLLFTIVFFSSSVCLFMYTGRLSRCNNCYNCLCMNETICMYNIHHHHQQYIYQQLYTCFTYRYYRTYNQQQQYIRTYALLLTHYQPSPMYLFHRKQIQML